MALTGHGLSALAWHERGPPLPLLHTNQPEQLHVCGAAASCYAYATARALLCVYLVSRELCSTIVVQVICAKKNYILPPSQ